MKSLISVCLVATMAFGMSACQEKRNEAYYFSHPDGLRTILSECQKNGGTPETFDTSCALAYRSAVQMTQLSQAFVQSQTDFGQRILRAQIRAANTVLQLNAAKKARAPVEVLEKQLALEEQHVNNLRAIVGLFIRM